MTTSDLAYVLKWEFGVWCGQMIFKSLQGFKKYISENMLQKQKFKKCWVILNEIGMYHILMYTVKPLFTLKYVYIVLPALVECS